MADVFRGRNFGSKTNGDERGLGDERLLMFEWVQFMNQTERYRRGLRRYKRKNKDVKAIVIDDSKGLANEYETLPKSRPQERCCCPTRSQYITRGWS